jgi:hypothetical protein
MSTLVKGILRRYSYLPDMERAATELVLEQTEVVCKGKAFDTLACIRFLMLK